MFGRLCEHTKKRIEFFQATNKTTTTTRNDGVLFLSAKTSRTLLEFAFAISSFFKHIFVPKYNSSWLHFTKVCAHRRAYRRFVQRVGYPSVRKISCQTCSRLDESCPWKISILEDNILDFKLVLPILSWIFDDPKLMNTLERLPFPQKFICNCQSIRFPYTLQIQTTL